MNKVIARQSQAHCHIAQSTTQKRNVTKSLPCTTQKTVDEYIQHLTSSKTA